MTDYRINIIADPTQAVVGQKVIRTELVRTDVIANRLGSTFARVFGAAAVFGGVAAAVRTMTNFGQEMSTVAAITNTTGADFDRLRERATQLGESTRFSATQAAEGMTFLARAGFNAAQVFESVDDTLNLAQAGALDLGTAADIASNVLQGFRLNVSEAGRVVDVLALAANSSNTDVQQLGDALKFVAPVAAGTGVAIEETTAAVGALSNAGLQASLAGTGLRRIISELESPATKTAKILRNLGVSQDEVRVSQVGLTAAIKRLAEAGVDTGQALEIFGDRGGPAFEVLSSSIPDVERLTAALLNADGTAKRIAATMDDNLNGSFLALVSAIEGFVIRLGDAGAEGALRSFVDTVTGAVRATVANIGTFISAVQSAATVLAIRFARQAIPAAVAGLRALGVAFLTNPVGVFATAVTLGIGALVGFGDVLEIAEGKTTTLQDVFVAAFDILGGVGRELADTISVAFEAVGVSVSSVFGDLELSIQGVLEGAAIVTDRTLGLFQGLGNALLALFAGIGPAAGDVFFQAMNGLVRLFEFGLDTARAVFATIAAQSRTIGVSILSFFGNIAAAIQTLVSGQAGAALEAASSAVEIFGNQIKRSVTDIPGVFRSELAKLESSDTFAKLDNPFENGARDLGAAVLEGFVEGIDVTLARDTLGEILERADEVAAANAAARAEAEAAKAATEAAAAAAAAAPPSSAPGSPEAGGGEGLSAEAGALLANINAPALEYAATQAQLNELLQKGEISAHQYAIALNEATIAANTLGSSASAGAAAGLAEVENKIRDTGGLIQQMIVDGFANAEDALVNFVQTGELDFSKFVDSLIADLTRLAIRQAILALLPGGAAVTAGAAAAGAVSGTKADGGPVGGGKSYLVGEEGPEIFTPRDAGRVVPAGETAAILGGGQQSAPVVNVAPPQINITNVSDPREIPSGIESPEGTEAILNVVSRNKRRVKGAIG